MMSTMMMTTAVMSTMMTMMSMTCKCSHRKHQGTRYGAN
jgi:hypothetical protein